MKSDAELEQCYGVGCLDCQMADCELRACGINRIREKQQETALKFAGKDEMVSDAEFDDSINFAGDYMRQICDIIDNPKQPLSDQMRQTKLDTLRHIAHFWAEKPKSFDAMMRKIMLGQNQSDIARQKGVSRQSISKAIRQEHNDKLKKRIVQLERLINVLVAFTPLELQVYQLCFNQKLSVRNAAKQLNISPTKVYRLKQILRGKMAKCETLKRTITKKR